MRTNHLCTPADHQLSRRSLLAAAGGTAAATVGFGPLLQSSFAEEVKKQAKQVLFVWLDGGMSQLESWDPKPNTEFGGPFRAIPTSVPGIHISEIMPKCAKQMHNLAILRSVSTKDNSHSAGVARIQRGDPKPRGVVYPFFGSAVAKLVGPGKSNLPPYVWIKPGSGGFIHGDAGFLGPKYGALAFGDGLPPENLVLNQTLTSADDDYRNSIREFANQKYAKGRLPRVGEAHAYVYDMARALMKRQELFDTSKFDPKDVQRYGTHEIGRHMLQARKMLEAGITFVKVNSYGWDTHGDNFNGSLNLVGKFDQAFAAILEDLSASGMLDNVLVVAMSEFGRTPRINGHIGRDHWPEAWSVAMSGAGVKRGVAIGKTSENGTEVDGEPHDIGDLFHTWFRCLGINSKKIEYDNNGQPLPLAHDDCKVVEELLV